MSYQLLSHDLIAQAARSHGPHITYLQAVVTGLIQGVTELFPVSSLGHNVLLPGLIGGSWAAALNVSATNSPYLAFIVGLHVATAIAMIAFFWRDWVRIVRGFFSSLAQRRIATPDQRLAWMIILATIPVGIVGAVAQKEFTKVFAKPELAAAFLAVNGVILLVSERMRRNKAIEAGGSPAVTATGAAAGGPGYGGPGYGAPGYGAPGYGGPAGRPAAGPPQGYQEQPRQQQWQGPDPRNGRDDWNTPRRGDREQPDGNGRDQYGPGQYEQGQQHGPGQRGPEQNGPGQQYNRGQYGPDPRGDRQPRPGPGQGSRYGQDPRGAQPGQGYDPRAGQDRRSAPDQQAAGRHASTGQHAREAARDERRADGRGADGRRGEAGAQADPAVAADARLSTMGYGRAIFVGAAQILALFPGISRDGIVTVAGMGRGLTRQDAVRFSFLLSAPVILAAGALKAHDLTGPMGQGIHGPVLVGSLLSGIGAYLSIRFLTRYFSEEKSLNPFGIYCLIAGIGSLAYLVLK